MTLKNFYVKKKKKKKRRRKEKVRIKKNLDHKKNSASKRVLTLKKIFHQNTTCKLKMFTEISNDIEKQNNYEKIKELSKLSKQITTDHKTLKE